MRRFVYPLLNINMCSLDQKSSIKIYTRKELFQTLSQIPWWFFVIILLISGVGYSVYSSYASVERLLVRLDDERITKISNISDNPELILGTEDDSTSFDTASKYLDSERIQTFDSYDSAVQALLD